MRADDTDLSKISVELKRQANAVRDRWFAAGRCRFFTGEGYRFSLSDDICEFGLLVGPSWTLQGTLHDMGHLVTMKPERIVQDSFGFDFGMPTFSMGRVFRESASLAPFFAEIDAMVFERLLAADMGFDVETPLETVSSLRFMPSFHAVPGSIDDERLRWLEAEFVRRSEGVAISDFEKLWTERIDMIPQLAADARGHEELVEKGTREIVWRHEMTDGCVMMIERCHLDDRELFSIVADLYEDLTFVGEAPTLERAIRRAERILDYNGYGLDHEEPEIAALA